MNRFLGEIDDLGRSLGELIDFYRKEGQSLLDTWAKIVGTRRDILFTGMGTSEFAPLSVSSALTELGISVRTLDAGEWLHYGANPKDERSLPVLVSQSGESIETTRLIEKYALRRRYVAITNDWESSLAGNAMLALPLHAGAEASISTKTYCNTLALLYLLERRIRGNGALDQAFRYLETLKDWLLDVNHSELMETAKYMLPGHSLVCVGRGPALVCAKQCALTFMEGARCVASAFSGGGFRHGPIEAVDSEFRLLLFSPAGKTADLMDRLQRSALAFGGRVVVFTDRQSYDLQESGKVIRIRNVSGPESEALFPVAVSAAQNLLLHYFAEARGIEAGRFRYGSKITVQE